MDNKYKFFPSECPVCGQPTTIEHGKDKKKVVIKLMCKNRECPGTAIKRLTKGIVVLDVREVGPSTIESLYQAGMRNSYDLFDRINFSEEKLIESESFKEGRALQKILDSVASVKEIPIDKAIASLQIDDIGTSFSLQIGKMLSKLPHDFTGFNIAIRDDLKKENSIILNTIHDGLSKFESFGVKIKYFEIKKSVAPTSKINKSFCFLEGTYDENIKNALIERGLNMISYDENPNIVVIKSKDDEEGCSRATEIGAKALTIQQLKLIYL